MTGLEIMGLIFIPIGIVSTAYWLTKIAWHIKERLVRK